jgi:hypothetical protein
MEVNTMQNEESLRKSLEDALPPIVPRHGIQRYGAMTVGRKVCYPRSSLIDWLLSRSTVKIAKAKGAQ